ncbi:MAG: carboxylating nicotinate-nucleotide diphosphorylase [Deltaproteobacteria bacterium]|nr:carboxylating nicotinate-nucleotide diphosphorylase [Deltaproteobacteria bacterium]
MSADWAAEFPLLAADRVLRAALEEDVGTGDVTTLCSVPAGARTRACLVAKEPLRLAGLPGFVRTFELLGAGDLSWDLHAADGDDLAAGIRVLDVEGDARRLLTGERTALNLLQRLSGIATMTARWCRHLEGTAAQLVDTRKTTPGLRALEKYAVRVGGARNHRTGLFDGVLLKENHLRAAGGIGPAVAAARARAPHTLRVEVEVTTLAELDEALASGADAVLLDNMDLATLVKAVTRTGGRALLEASGGVTEERLRTIAETGVDLVSAGALTHSARAVDLSFLFEV